MYKIGQRISRDEAYELIVTMATIGNHIHDLHGRLRTGHDVALALASQGIDIDALAEDLRDFNKPVPGFENLFSSTWQTAGVTVSRKEGGDDVELVAGDGSFTESDYWALFEISTEDFRASLDAGNYRRLLSGVNAGLAAIEGFLNAQCIAALGRAEAGKRLHQRLDRKIDEWTPKLTGSRLDKSGRVWHDFFVLRGLRDEEFQHPKKSFSGITHSSFVVAANRFRAGVAGMLVELHKLYRVRCPSQIIRHSFLPKVSYQRDEITPQE